MKIQALVLGIAATLFMGNANMLHADGGIAGVTQTADALAAKKCRKGYAPSKKTGRCITIRRGSG